MLFNGFVAAMLVADLKVFHRKAHAAKIREALLWSAFWVGLALVFNLGIYFWYQNPTRPHAALEFLTGYLLEKSLSVDNLFVFLLIFSYFTVQSQYQHNVLFWGIIGAMILRAIFIIAGVALIRKFHWVIYIFGAILIASGVKMAKGKENEVKPENNPVLKLFRRFAPVATDYVGTKFFLRRNGHMLATPLVVVLLVVETTDIVFAMDSIPAVLGITQDPFIVYTSNIFAIMGLRALYFALAGVMDMFHHLHYGLSAILAFVGVKMLLPLLEPWLGKWSEIPIGLALSVVAGILALSIITSIIWPSKKKTDTAA